MFAGDGCCAGVLACCCWGGVLGRFCWGVAADAAPLADRGTVTVGVTVLTATGSELPAELLESVCVTKDCLLVDVVVGLPEVSPALFAGAAAVPVSLPAITGVVSSAVFAGGSLLMRLLRFDVGMVTVGVTVLMDAGSELPADFAEVAAVRVASLAEAGEVTLGVAGVGAAESVSRADAADGFSDVVTEQIAVGGSAWTTVVPVNMVNVQTDTVGDYRFSPGVGCRIPLVRQNWDDMAYWERPELLGNDSDSSEVCGCSPPGDFYDPRDYEEEWERNFVEEADGYWLADSLHETEDSCI